MRQVIAAEHQPQDSGASKPGARRRAFGRLRLAGPFMPTYLAPIWARRSRSMLLALALGMLVAATLLGSVPVYSDLVSDVQLQYVLAAHPAIDIDVEGIVTTGDLTDANARRIDAIALSTQHSLLAGFAPSMSTYMDSDSVAFRAINGQAVTPGAEEHVQRSCKLERPPICLLLRQRSTPHEHPPWAPASRGGSWPNS